MTYQLPEPAIEHQRNGKVTVYYTKRQMQAAWQAGRDAREDLTIAYMAGYSKGRDSMKAECVKAVHNCLNDYVFTADMAGHAGRHLQLAENAIKELK